MQPIIDYLREFEAPCRHAMVLPGGTGGTDGENRRWRTLRRVRLRDCVSVVSGWPAPGNFVTQLSVGANGS
jgi:hypothetical protein